MINRIPKKVSQLNKKELYSQKVLEIFKTWRKEHFTTWYILNAGNKKTAIENLYDELNKQLQVDIIIKFESLTGALNSYNSTTETVTLETIRPSLLAAIHEYGHAILGKSEDRVKQWVKWILKHEFPEATQKLRAECLWIYKK
jgi:hypothetical protein